MPRRVLWGEHVAATVRSDGNKVSVIGVLRRYRDGEFVEDEEIRQLVTPDFAVYATITSGADDPNAGMVTTEQVSRLLAPILCGGRFGFELDGYVGDGIRILELILMEPDKARYVGEKEINGFVSQQVDADTRHGFFSVFIDIENNYAIRRIVSVRRQGDLRYGGGMYLQNMSQTETFTEILDNLEFELIDEVNIPTKGKLQLIRRDRDGSIRESQSEYERTNIVLNPSFGEDVFSAAFLRGEVISNLDDTVSGVVYIWDGEQAVPAFTMLEGGAWMHGTGGYVRLFSMLLGIAMVIFALYMMLLKKKR